MSIYIYIEVVAAINTRIYRGNNSYKYAYL